MLLAAFGFQYVGDLDPCEMCIWQRWPHAAAVLVGGFALAFRNALLPILGAMATMTTAGLGLYHAGVERKWWMGPNTCTSPPVSDLSVKELMEQIMAAPLVRCDDIPWEMYGISMAGWNALVSLGLAGLWFLAAGARN